MINERKTVNQNKEQQEYVLSILTYRADVIETLAKLLLRGDCSAVRGVIETLSKPLAKLRVCKSC